MIKQLRQFGANVWLLAVVLLASPVLSYAQTVEYYHLDALGSVRAVSNQAGELIEQHDYLPFGEEDMSSSGSQSLRFTGKERDRESGFDYFGARYYAARTARFTTVDPAMEIERNIADPQNWNRYAYAGNNPLKNVDPDGRSWWAAIEAAFTVNDVRDAVQTWRDPNASRWDRGATIFGTAIGAVAPGGAFGPVLRKLDDGAKSVTKAFQVGPFNQLQRTSQVGDELALHHAGQKHAMAQVVPGYDSRSAPAIALPTRQHKAIPNRRGPYTGTARDLLAQDIRNLRTHTRAPNPSLMKLIDLNKQAFPGEFKK